LPSDFAAPYHAPIYACVSLLDEIREKASSFRENTKDETLVPVRKKWRWPFSRPETLDLMNKIQSYEAGLGLMLTTDGLSATLRVLRESKTSQEMLRDVHNHSQAASQIKLDDDNQELLSLVGPYSPRATLKTNVKLWRPGTCLWVTEGPELAECPATENSKLWVSGISGAGRSILAGQIIQKSLSLSNKENRVAYFFCDYQRQETQSLRSILDLFIYALSNGEEAALDLLKCGYKINGCQGRPHHNYLYTALHTCARYGYVQTMNMILDKHLELLFLDTEIQNDCVEAMLDRSRAC